MTYFENFNEKISEEVHQNNQENLCFRNVSTKKVIKLMI